MHINADISSRNSDLKKLRLEYSKKNNLIAITLFSAALIFYMSTFVATLYVGWPYGILLALACAWGIAMLFIVGHDACHQSYTTSATLNKIIGRVCFLPSLTNYQLWDLGHNRTHHRYNNVRGLDYVWEPMSPSDYAAASRSRRLLYRVWRSPFGIPLNYLFDLWPLKMFFIRKDVVGEKARDYWMDGAITYGFAVAQTVFALVVGSAFGNGPWESWLLAVAIPFVIWNVLMSVVIYLHHTHPEVPWYSSVEEWRDNNGKLTGTVHVRFPWVLRKLMLEIMEHNAHHYAPGVPLYNLSEMQSHLHDEKIVEWTWSFSEYFRIARTCKLYDFEKKIWLPFN